MYRLNDYLIKHYQSCLRFTCELHNQTIDNLFAHRQNVNTHKTKSQKTLIRPHHLISRQVLCPRKYLRVRVHKFPLSENLRLPVANAASAKMPEIISYGGRRLSRYRRTAPRYNFFEPDAPFSPRNFRKSNARTSSPRRSR